MLLKQLEYLIAVVDENSFTEAAEKLYISQSAVSQGIQALERSLNARLLIRRGRSFTLTLAGQYCYRRAKALLGDLTDMENEIARIARGEAGELCVGYLNLYAGPELSETVCRIPLYRGKDRIHRKYCLFWQKKWTSEIIEDFAALFRKKLTQ